MTYKILFLEDSEQDVELMKFELDLGKIKHVSKRVSNKKDFLLAITEFNPDVILADYTLPSFNGMHAYRLFKDYGMLIPFILVTGSLNEELALECLTEGVDDVLLKSGLKRLPIIVIRSLELKLAEQLQVKTTDELQLKNEELKLLHEKADKERAHNLLSNREFEVFCQIASGKTIKEIAGELFLSTPTVTTYRLRLLEKLNLKSNVEITRYALKHNLID